MISPDAPFTRAGATALSYSRIAGAAERVRMGFIGLGNRGDQVPRRVFWSGATSQTGWAICDLREDYLDVAAGKSRGTPARYPGYRRLLDNKKWTRWSSPLPITGTPFMFI